MFFSLFTAVGITLGRAPAWVVQTSEGESLLNVGPVLELMLFSTEGGRSRQLQVWWPTVSFSTEHAAPGRVSHSLGRTVPDCVGTGELRHLLELPKEEAWERLPQGDL